MAAGKVVASAGQDAGVLGCGNPDLSLTAERLREVMQHGVVRLRCTRGPDDLKRTTTQKGSQLFSRCIERNFGALADAVRTRRISRETARWHPTTLAGRWAAAESWRYDRNTLGRAWRFA